MSTLLKMTVNARPDPYLCQNARGILARETFTGATVEEIADAFRKWRDETGLASSQIGARYVVKRGREKIALISYNGRIWPVGE